MSRRVFHILAPKPRGAFNAFYPAGSPRVEKTLCGAPVTSHDIRFGWQAFGFGDFVPCEKCVAIRQQSKRQVVSQKS